MAKLHDTHVAILESNNIIVPNVKLQVSQNCGQIQMIILVKETSFLVLFGTGSNFGVMPDCLVVHFFLL